MPGTAYPCGTPTNNDPRRQAVVALGASYDAGHTWQTWDTRLRASACQVVVDPTNAQDLLLHLLTCLPCSPVLPAQLARSADGGRSWHRALPPPLPGDLLIGMLASTPGGIMYAELVSFGGPTTATEGVSAWRPARRSGRSSAPCRIQASRWSSPGMSKAIR